MHIREKEKGCAMRGKFIVFDGGEGAGKSSVLKYVCEQLGDSVVRTREPGGTPFAEDIRALILSERGGQADPRTVFLLFLAARNEHIARVIDPSLKAGKHVLCDRFDSSTWAYQVCGEGHSHLKRSFRHLSMLVPNHYIIFDGDPRILLSRARLRSVLGGQSTHFDNRGLEYHERVRKGFLEFVSRAEVKHTIVNAEEPAKIVQQKVLDIVRTLVSQ